MNAKFVFSLVLALIWFSPVFSETKEIPFKLGEELHYKLKWGIFKVGYAKLEVQGPVDFNGEDAYHFIFTVKTTRWADAFYKVRDKSESFVDIGLTRTLHYRKDQSEGRHRKKEIVTFDWENKKVHYKNFDKSGEPLDLGKNVFDPLSVLFIARLGQYENGDPVFIPVTDGKNLMDLEIVLQKRETLKTRAGIYKTILLEPDTRNLGGVFKKSKGASLKIWFSDDNRKIPVKLKSKVEVGHFTAELIKDASKEED